MDDMEQGACALQLASALVFVMVSRDPTIADEMEQRLATGPESPNEVDRRAVAHSNVIVAVARIAAQNAHNAAERERARTHGDKPPH